LLIHCDDPRENGSILVNSFEKDNGHGPPIELEYPQSRVFWLKVKSEVMFQEKYALSFIAVEQSKGIVLQKQ